MQSIYNMSITQSQLYYTSSIATHTLVYRQGPVLCANLRFLARRQVGHSQQHTDDLQQNTDAHYWCRYM